MERNLEILKSRIHTKELLLGNAQQAVFQLCGDASFKCRGSTRTVAVWCTEMRGGHETTGRHREPGCGARRSGKYRSSSGTGQQPVVLGFFSVYVDLARYGDSRYLFGSGGLKGFSSMIEPLKGLGMVPYVRDHDRKDPVLSPMYANLTGFQPTFCMTSTRDHCLSGTVDFHRALLRLAWTRD